MSDKNIKTRMIAFADRVSGFDDPSMGDEREANVIMRGHTFALVVGSGTLTLAGAGFALFGFWHVALGAVLLGALQSYLAIGYAAAHGVSIYGLTDRSTRKRKIASVIIYFATLVVLLGARFYQLRMGHPVFGDYGSLEVTSETTGESIGMIVGAALGIVIIFALLKLRTRQRERSEEDD
jgi:high-affinity Fe2+/Pb2+ permease